MLGENHGGFAAAVIMMALAHWEVGALCHVKIVALSSRVGAIGGGDDDQCDDDYDQCVDDDHDDQYDGDDDQYNGDDDQ